jgi:2,3-bisphosphoglycerate-independent phosphoglycerate mutase
VSKILLVILDGLGDRQHAVLDGRTPLEAADTPNLDALASAGACGTMYSIGPGRAPTSFQAHFALFGYPPEEYPGRGLLEAIGEGMPPEPGEVVLRASLLSAEESGGAFTVTHRPDPRHGECGLADIDLNATFGDVHVRFVHTDARQGLVYVSSAKALSHHVTDADPFREGLPVLAVQATEEAPDQDAAARTADALNAWMLLAHERLSAAGSPGEFMVTKWAGASYVAQPFPQRYGLNGACVASGPLYAGLASVVGMRHVETGCDLRDPRADLEKRIETALELLGGEIDFVHAHTKAPDHAAHKKDPARKRDVIERLDIALGLLVRERVWERDIVVAITADHATPSAGPLYHSGEAVPLLVLGGATGVDDVAVFGERACTRGMLGNLRGNDLMPLLLNAADRCVSTGERFTRTRQWAQPRVEDLVALRKQ